MGEIVAEFSVMKPIRIGIVGIGNIGAFHTNNFLEGKVANVELTAICDINPAALARFPNVKHFFRSEDLIRSGEIDGILIATPHYFHTTIGIAALQQGLHVLVEKPISVHKADCERLIAAHQNPKQVFAAMFDTRTEPRYIKLRELVQSGELGQIKRINWILTNWFRSDAYYASSNWRATWAGEGGGILVNQLPHDLDLLQWIFGMPSRVRGFCGIGRYHDIEVEDEINAYLEYPNGATALLTATTGEAPGTDRREVVGDRGRVIVHADRLEFTRTETPTSEFCRTTPQSFATPGSWEISIPIHGKAGRHVEVIQRFVNAIQNGAPLVARAEEGIASVELANAILYSSMTEQTVELPLDGAAYEAFLKTKIATSRFRLHEPVAKAATSVDMGASFKH